MPKQTTEQQVLYNLANIHAINFCKKHNVDCSGTHTEKQKRNQFYNLVKTDTKECLITVFFHKSSIPTYIIYNQYDKQKHNKQT